LKLIQKAGSIAIASALLLTYMPQVWAEDTGVTVSSPLETTVKGEPQQADVKITKEQAIELTKKYVDLPEGFTLQSVSLNSYPVNGSNRSSWSLSFSKKVKDQSLGYLNVTINGTTGKLVDYSFNDNDPGHKPSYPPKVDYQGAKDIAAKWIAKLNPEEQSHLTYNIQTEQAFRTPLNGSFQYNIRYDRSVNDIPFQQNGINVSVNGDGVVTGYNYNWDDSITFEEKGAPLRAVGKVFRDKADVSLIYQIPNQAKGEKKPIIAYSMNSFFIDAKTGELWSPTTVVVPSIGKLTPLTDKPLGDKPASNLNLTKEQAVAKVTSIIKLPEGVTLQNASFNENTDPDTGDVHSSWNLSWNTASDKESMIKPGYSIWANVNSKTGELLSYSQYAPYPDGKQNQVDAKVSLDEAKAKAIDFVKKQLPAYTDQLVLDTSIIESIPADQLKNTRTWDFNFKRVIDGVIANYENVSVGIDRTSGDIVNCNFYFSSLPYPAKKPEVLSIEKAKDLLFSQYEIQQVYVTANGISPIPYFSGSNAYEKYKVMIAAGEIPPGTSPETAHQAKLVYALVPKYYGEPFFLEATSGQWKNASTGEDITLDKLNVTDIQGHWAQNELQLMLDYKALDVADGKVNPDQAITRGELIKMLVIAMNGGQTGIRYSSDRAASFADVKKESPYFAYVENAVDRGLIDRGETFNPSAKMNREEVAHLIVRALGYDKLSAYSSIFNDDFADAATLKSRGEVAIVVGLGIMSLSEGSFKPVQEVTRAQAATAFFRYLQKRAELQDTPSNYWK
jgi:hypothetical protein